MSPVVVNSVDVRDAGRLVLENAVNALVRVADDCALASLLLEGQDQLDGGLLL